MNFQLTFKKWSTWSLMVCSLWGSAQAQMVDSYTLPYSPSAHTLQHKQGQALKVLPTHTLSAVATHDELMQIRRTQERSIGQPPQIGVRRDLPTLKSSQDFSSLLAWKPASDGSLHASLEFTSENAVGMRLMLDIERIDPAVVLRFYQSAQDTQPVEVRGTQIINTLMTNRQAQPDLARDVYVGPLVEGQKIVLSIELPAGQSPADLKINTPHMSHLYASALQPDGLLNSKASESCNINVKCYSDWEQDPGNAVARMLFTDSVGVSYVCTGTLLADKNHTKTPYFYTAAHCINRQFEASNLINAWFYKSMSCSNNSAATGTFVVQRGGATLLHTNTKADATLLQLKDIPPAGVLFAGWSASLPAISTSITGIHHPSGDVQKITFSSVAGYMECSLVSQTFECVATPASTASHIALRHTRGVTEGGSSGSGVFQTISGKPYLVGQLSGGSSSCGNPNGIDVYGRFDQVYPNIKQWIDAASPPPTGSQRAAVYRFYNVQTKAHFYTINPAERDYVIATNPAFDYEGQVFYAFTGAATGLDPVFRFYNVNTYAHFYTISAAERDYVLQTNPPYKQEDNAWYARTQTDAGTIPLYRFYNVKTSTHFYTTNAAERDYVIQTNPDFHYEGTAYHVWSTP